MERFSKRVVDKVSKMKFRKWQNYHKNSKRCFVVGNGPSLNRIDMTKLKDEITFGSNRCFLGFERWGYHFKYWVCQDELLFKQGQQDFWNELSGDIPKFIPQQFRDFTENRPQNLNYFPMIYRPKVFPSFLLNGNVLCEGWTVTYGMIQLAVYMGLTEIILVGVDHNYDISKDMINEKGKWSDKNSNSHFDPSYCNSGAGQVWNLPQVDKMNMAYHCAAKFCKKNKIKILNATPGSKLGAFEKVGFESLF